MAKRKTSKKRKGSRRRRVGALSPSSPLVKIGAVAVGYFAGPKINQLIDKVTQGKIDNKIVGGVSAAAGALLLMSKRSSLIKTVPGGLLAGAGARRLKDALMPAPVATTPAVSGYGSVPVLGGYGSVPVLGNRTPRLNGYNAGGTLGSYIMNSGRVMGSVDGSSRIGDN